MPALLCNSNPQPRHFSITLGGGPRWWSWCPPRRLRHAVFAFQHRGQRCGETKRALCEPWWECRTGGAWPKWPGCAADICAAPGAEHGGVLGDCAVAAAALHAGAVLPAARRLQGRLCVGTWVCRGGAQMHSHHRMLEERSYWPSPACPHLHVPGIPGPGSRTPHGASLSRQQHVHALCHRVVAQLWPPPASSCITPCSPSVPQNRLW